MNCDDNINNLDMSSTVNKAKDNATYYANRAESKLSEAR